MKKKLNIGDSYEIEWFDTFSFNGWYNDEELENKTKKMNYLQRSVGIFAGEYHNWIILATHENPNESFAKWGHPDWIYRGTITKITKIKVHRTD